MELWGSSVHAVRVVVVDWTPGARLSGAREPMAAGVASVDGAALGAWLSEAAALPGWCVCACVCVRSGAG
jgi:hypothetical protein